MKKILAALFVLFIVVMMLGCQKNSPTSPAATETPTPNMTQTAVYLETAGLTAQETATAQAQLTANAQATLVVQETSTEAAQQTANAQATETATFNVIVTHTPMPTSTHTGSDNVSGTLTLPSSQPGKYYYIAVYTGSIGSWVAQDTGICSSSTSIPFSLYVPAGSGYGIIALVNAMGPDVLGNICGMDGPPRAGDYIGQNGTAAWPTPGPSFSAPASGVDIQMSVAPANLQGTITLPSPQPGKIIAIEVSDSVKGGSSNMNFTFFDVLGSSSTYNYSVCAIIPGSYYVYGFVDVDNNAQIGNDIYNPSTPAGDYLGYYGGSGVNPPGATTVLNYSPTNYLNFNLGME